MLRIVADARGCEPDDLASDVVSHVQTIALSLVMEGYALARDEPTIKTLIPPGVGE